MGNMLADVTRAFYGTDVGFFNSGGTRIDQILKSTVPDGEPLLIRDIISKAATSFSQLTKTDNIRYLPIRERPSCEEAHRRDYPALTGECRV
jgi:hypothetical protein